MDKQRYKQTKSRGTQTSYFLLPDQLLEHEITSLKRMARIPWPTALSSWQRLLFTAANHAQNKRQLELHLTFEAHDPRARATDVPYLIELGAKIELSGHPLVSYFIAIGYRDTVNTRCGLRKCHFDVESIPNTTEPKPVLHMQFPGSMPSVLSKSGYPTSTFDLLKPKVEKPRIPSLPTSFALLTHWALLEYHTTVDQIQVLVNSAEWMSVVKASESAILEPFFEHSRSWICQTSNEKLSLLSYFYGLPRLR